MIFIFPLALWLIAVIRYSLVSTNYWYKLRENHEKALNLFCPINSNLKKSCNCNLIFLLPQFLKRKVFFLNWINYFENLICIHNDGWDCRNLTRRVFYLNKSLASDDLALNRYFIQTFTTSQFYYKKWSNTDKNQNIISTESLQNQKIDASVLKGKMHCAWKIKSNCRWHLREISPSWLQNYGICNVALF